MIEHDENEHEQQTFLRVAEAVLQIAHAPLKAREIVERGIERGLFGDHVLGRTPEKSMQARLSTEIIGNKTSSTFVRTSRGRFMLRRRLQADKDEAIRTAGSEGRYSEYIAEPRVLRTPVEDVLCALKADFEKTITFQGIDTNFDATLKPLLSADLVYMPRSRVESVDDAKQFVTYVIVQCGHRVLSFERSYLSRAAEFLRGAKCIGFGGHVSAADLDIFSGSDRGIEACARRELAEELTLPTGRRADKRSAERAVTKLFGEAPIQLLGVLNDDSSEVGRRHLAIVYRVWLDDWSTARLLKKGESSLRSLDWIDLTSSGVDINQFEYWSQLCIRKFYPSNSLSNTSLHVVNASHLVNSPVAVVAGRVGSGKSATARYLAQRCGVPVVNSGEVLGQIMGVGTLAELGRERFQREALNFIRRRTGPQLLGEALAARIRGVGGRAIVDGVRHTETFDALKAGVERDIAVIFVHNPPDISYEFYRYRDVAEGVPFSYRDFLKIYDADVEVDISSLGRIADAYVYNSTSLEEVSRVVDSLCEQFPGMLKAQEIE